MTDDANPTAGDPPIDPATELASAYLDGELSAEERARAEADPAVVAEVERLRVAVAAVRDVEPPTASAREAAIAAALGAFDDEQHPAAALAAASAGGADRRPPSVVPIPSRRPTRAGRWLGVAAAAVGVLAVGAVIASGGLGGSDDDEASTDAPAEVASEMSDSAAQETVRLGDEDAADSAGGATEAVEEATELGDPVPEGTVATAGTNAPMAATGEGEGEVPVLASLDELAAFGAVDATTSYASTLPSTCPPALSDARPVGPARYVGDGLDADVLVVVDDAGSQVLAVDPVSCSVVAAVPTATSE